MKTEHDQVKDLAMLVKRLSRFAPPSIAADAIDYLKRYNLLGSLLRDEASHVETEGKQP